MIDLINESRDPEVNDKIIDIFFKTYGWHLKVGKIGIEMMFLTSKQFIEIFFHDEYDDYDGEF